MTGTEATLFLYEYKKFDKQKYKKIFNAIWSLRDEAKGCFISFTDIIEMKTVLDVLREKHLEQRKANLNYLVSNERPKGLPYHQSTFEKLNASMVRKPAMKTHGSLGPSGLDSNKWRKLLTAFRSSSIDLCKTDDKLAIRIATSHMTFLLLFNSCRLVVHDKCPGVRPMGIGEYNAAAMYGSKQKKLTIIPW